MLRRPVVPVAAALIGVLLLAACGSSSKANRSVPTDASANPVPLFALAEQGTVNGRLGLSTALQIFAWQYGSVPEVKTPSGKPGAAVSGNLAIASIMAHWSELTDAQRNAISKKLNLPPDFTPRTRRSAMGKSRPRAPQPSSTAYPAETNRVIDQLALHFGPLAVPYWIANGSSGGNASADTLLRSGANGDGCYVTVYPSTFSGTTDLTVVLAHELFHCYQQVWADDTSPWVIEGGAAWVGNAIANELGAGGDTFTSSYINAYVRSPLTPLFARSYDALGWYGYVQEQGVDLWSRLRPMTEAGNDAAAYQIATQGLGQEYVDGWSSAQMDYEPWGNLWMINAPGIPIVSTNYALGGPAIPNGGGFTIDAPGYAAGRKSVKYTAELTRITLTGNGGGFEHNADGDSGLAGLSGKTWCTGPKNECVCPAKTRRAGQMFDRLAPGDRTIALSGGTAGSQLLVEGISLEDECNKTSCAVGAWRFNGDPVAAAPIKGGAGILLTIEPSGLARYDFGPSERIGIAAPGGFALSEKVNGTATALLNLPTDPNGGSATFTDSDASGLTVSDLQINGSTSVSGFSTDLIADAVNQQIRQGILTGNGAVTVSCPGNQLVIQGSTVTLTYTRVGK